MSVYPVGGSMRYVKSPNIQCGFSLIEVLVAFAILGVGLVAMAQLHRVALLDLLVARGNSTAQLLAGEKIEDLRRYETLVSQPGKLAYADIGDDTGGRIAAGKITVNGITFSRNWSVTDWYFDEDGDATPSVPAPPPSYPPFKAVTVTLVWTDPFGLRKELSLATHIVAEEPASLHRALQASSG